ncbi:MAG: hypothetical protein PHP54_01885 [Clostridia bacterium]|nr:hypothetical protein [Clostridia bacterium]
MCKYLRDFSQEEMVHIAKLYATNDFVTRSLLADERNTTVDVISEILSQSISKRLVSLDTAIQMAKRAMKNVKPYKGSERTCKHYSKLILDAFGVELKNYISCKQYSEEEYNYQCQREEDEKRRRHLIFLKESYPESSISDDDGAPSYDEIENELERLTRYLA